MQTLKAVDELIESLTDIDCKNEQETNNNDDSNPYNKDETVQLYIHFHFCDEMYFNVPNFAKRVSEIAVEYTNISQRNRVLDLGCATGRTSFELCKHFEFVDGIDYAKKLIDVAKILKKEKQLKWSICNHGLIRDKYSLNAFDDLGLSDKQLNKVHFAVGDAHQLDCNKYTNYDCIIACNLIDRLHTPMLFLNAIHDRINENGVLIILDPYTWLEQYTNKRNWIGAKDGISTFDALKKILANRFEFVKQMDVPFVIRETARKYQHSLSHCTIWKLKSKQKQ